MAIVLDIKKRKTKPHSNITEVRESGRIPAIVYGYQSENVPVSVDELDLLKLVRENGRNAVFTVNLDGKKVNVLLHDYQIDPLKNKLVHVDLLAVDMKAEVEAEVRIDLVGESTGVKEGGVLQQVLHEVTVSATPDKLPESVEVDISELGIGDSVEVSKISTSKAFEIITDGEEVIATVTAPRVEEESTTEEVAEPEAAHGTNEEPVE
ncbi:General stress protein CTC [Listeria grayi]|uniref:50S ribosomal protein L25/general stress protein Ctc n=1 Tax=Listeria grayi TaxID=1641 RepID=UPI000F70E1B1|nr:50S ribosomal protein L25/general stress protein Ctc [Listeria grayi]VEI30834.1 General stress protein CTC [Listeria grayi]